MSSPNSRKRPAPGASPMVSMPQAQFSPVQNEFRWNGSGGIDSNGFVDAAPSPGPPFTIMSPSPFGPPVAASSTALARRGNNNRALVPSAGRPPLFDGSSDWANFDHDSNFLPPSNGQDEDDIEQLEEEAQRAKREAQAKRKQIPPFVQKLSR